MRLSTTVPSGKDDTIWVFEQEFFIKKIFLSGVTKNCFHCLDNSRRMASLTLLSGTNRSLHTSPTALGSMVAGFTMSVWCTDDWESSTTSPQHGRTMIPSCHRRTPRSRARLAQCLNLLTSSPNFLMLRPRKKTRSCSMSSCRFVSGVMPTISACSPTWAKRTFVIFKPLARKSSRSKKRTLLLMILTRSGTMSRDSRMLVLILFLIMLVSTTQKGVVCRAAAS